MECNSLQKECSVLRSEKQDMVNKHQKEKISLQSECASLRAEKEELLKSHQKEKANLQSECAALCSEKEEAVQKQQQLQRDLVRSVQWLTLPIAQRCPSSLLLFPLSRSVDSAAVWISAFILFFFGVVVVTRTLSWMTASEPLNSLSRSYWRSWRACSSSTSRIATSCKRSWERQTAAAELCRERYGLQTEDICAIFQINIPMILSTFATL